MVFVSHSVRHTNIAYMIILARLKCRTLYNKRQTTWKFEGGFWEENFL